MLGMGRHGWHVVEGRRWWEPESIASLSDYSNYFNYFGAFLGLLQLQHFKSDAPLSTAVPGLTVNTLTAA